MGIFTRWSSRIDRCREKGKLGTVQVLVASETHLGFLNTSHLYLPTSLPVSAAFAVGHFKGHLWGIKFVKVDVRLSNSIQKTEKPLILKDFDPIKSTAFMWLYCIEYFPNLITHKLHIYLCNPHESMVFGANGETRTLTPLGART